VSLTLPLQLLFDQELMHAVAGENESEIMKLIRAIPKETGKA
jgi:hypothetical protein